MSAKVEKAPVPVLFGSASECCGCGGCVARCPVQAIEMIEDECGYQAPKINEGACIRCGLCKKVCGFQSVTSWFECNTPPMAYAACAKGGAPNSASGGVFAELAKAVLESAGVVYGAAYEAKGDGLHVRHRRVADVDGLLPLLGSKYVQSDAMSCYSEAEEDLNAGLLVLFSGTPCQIAGLKGYLRRDYKNLLTVDLVCHGVPNEKMLREYAHGLENHYGSRVIDLHFRNKRDGWDKSLLLLVRFEDGRELAIPASESSYYDLFLNLKTLRDSCYECPFAGGARPADISIGDYWGVQVRSPELLEENGGEFSLKRGVSCLLVNSERGSSGLEQFGDGLTLDEVEFDSIAAGNDQLRAPAVLPDDRDDYLLTFSRSDWGFVEKLWRKRTLLRRVKQAVGSRIPKDAKDVLKRLLGMG